MRIYKYRLDVADEQQVTLPVGANILSTHVQDGLLQLWVMVDETEKQTYQQTILIYGTGNPVFPFPKEFVGTVFLLGGTLVFHVFKG